MLARTALFLALTTLAACVEPQERSRDFTYLHATIIEPSCATSNCHSAMTKQANVDLSEVDISCTTLVEGGYAMPGDPDASEGLIDMLQGESMFLVPMPLDGPLPPADITLISQWIEEGASCE